MKPVIDWKVQDLAAEGDDKHRTEWRATYMKHVLVIQRRRGEFDLWMEREGSSEQLNYLRGSTSLESSKTTLYTALIKSLDGRVIQEDERDAIRLPLVCLLEEAYETTAHRMKDSRLYGQALKFMLDAEAMRHEGEAIRRRVEARLNAARKR